MEKYRNIMRKCENSCGIYETKKYRYVVRYGLHIELQRIDKSLLGTTATLDENNWKTVFTLL